MLIPGAELSRCYTRWMVPCSGVLHPLDNLGRKAGFALTAQPILNSMAIELLKKRLTTAKPNESDQVSCSVVGNKSLKQSL